MQEEKDPQSYRFITLTELMEANGGEQLKEEIAKEDSEMSKENQESSHQRTFDYDQEQQTTPVVNAKEDLLKKIINSQETYIRELEQKSQEMKETYEQEISSLRDTLSDISAKLPSTVPNAQASLETIDEHESEHDEVSAKRRGAHKDSPVSSAAWDQEREMLMDLVKKNQDLADLAQDKTIQKETEMRNLIKQTEKRYEDKLTILSSENKMLKEMLDKKFVDKERKEFTTAIRSQLFEEMERLHKEHKKREDELVIEVSRLSKNSDVSAKTFNDFKNTANKEKLELTKKLNDLQSLFDKTTNDLDLDKKALTRKNEDLTKKLNEQVGDLSKYKTLANEHSKARFEEEEEYTKQKQQILESLLKSSEIFEDKERLLKERIETIDNEKKTTIASYEAKLSQLARDKQKIESHAKEYEDLIEQKLTSNGSEIKRLRTVNGKLVDLEEEREVIFRDEIETLRDGVLRLQGDFDDREKKFLEDSKKSAESIEKYYEILKKAENKLVAGWKTNGNLPELQEKEIKALQSQLKNKTKESEDLKVQVAIGLSVDRKTITEALERSEKTLDEIMEKHNQAIIDLETVRRDLVQCDELHNRREYDDAELINGLTEEVGALKFTIRSFEAKNYENIITELKEKQVKVEAELEHAKKNLVNYINSYNALEDKVKDKLENNRTLDENDEVMRLKLENMRLNEENASLLNAKHNIENFYIEELEKANHQLQLKVEDYDELYNKYTRLLAENNNRRLEEISAWQKRQDSILKTIKSLERELNDYKTLRTLEANLKTQERILEHEELVKLRDEANRVEEFWKKETDKWQTEKKLMEQEIASLRNRADAAEEYHIQMGNLMHEEHQILTSERTKLQQNLSNLARLIEEREKLINFISDRRGNYQQDIKAVKDLNQTLKKEVALLQDEISKEKDDSKKKMDHLRETYQLKVDSGKEQEARLRADLESMSSHLELYRNNFESLVTNYEKELQQLRSEITAHRSLTILRQSTAVDAQSALQNELAKLFEFTKDVASYERQKANVDDGVVKVRTAFEEKSKRLKDIEKEALRKGEKRPAAELSDFKKELTVVGGFRNWIVSFFEKEYEERVALAEIIGKIRKYMEKITDGIELEKKLLQNEVEFMKIALDKREARFDSEIDSLKSERDQLILKLAVIAAPGQRDDPLKILRDIIEHFESERLKAINDEKKILASLKGSGKESSPVEKIQKGKSQTNWATASMTMNKSTDLRASMASPKNTKDIQGVQKVKSPPMGTPKSAAFEKSSASSSHLGLSKKKF